MHHIHALEIKLNDNRVTKVYIIFATLSAAMGAIFGMATCLSAQARDAPEDPTNYFIGGCASGIFLGARSEYIKHNSILMIFNI